MLRRWPSQCRICHAWPAQTLCAACTQRFTPVQARCAQCAQALPAGRALCGSCASAGHALDACTACVDYAWPWTQCIAAFKYSAQPGLAGPLADLMRTHSGVQAALAQASVVLPMPLAAQRLRERGFNQSLLLARRLDAAKVDAHLLLRIRETAPQAGLNRAERLRNVRGAFALEPARAHEVRGQHVLLVDDVMTTGATLSAAAQALRAAGAAHIGAVVLARAAAAVAAN